MSVKWFVPEQLVASSFIDSTLQPATTRLALIFELCGAAGAQPRLTKERSLVHWKDTWFKIYTSPRIDVQKFARSGAELPDYFVNFAVYGRRLDSNDPFYTRSHLGAVNESVEGQWTRFISTYATGYRLLPKPSPQGVLEFSIAGNLPKLLSLHHEFSTTLDRSNPLEGKCVRGLALHAIISRDFGFVYEMLKQINDSLDASNVIRVQADIGPITLHSVGKLRQGFHGARDPKKMEWLNGRYRNLVQKQGDFERQDYCTAADDLTKQRCTMLVDAGLIETSRYGNWQFTGFDKALQYFDGVFEAIKQLSVDDDVQPLGRSWFDRARPEVMLPLAWNYYLDQIEKHRIPQQEEYCGNILVPFLQDMVALNIRRIRLVELFSLVHIIHENVYCNPINIFTTLQSMAGQKLVLVNNNHGDPIVTINNKRGITVLDEEE